MKSNLGSIGVLRFMESKMDLFQDSWARFNSFGNHRYVLFRRWSDGPAAMVIGLNPSTANGVEDDPTIGFVKRVLNHNGFGALYMVNLFTYISSNPQDLKGPASCSFDRKQCLKTWNKYLDCCDNIIFAWGQFETFGRDQIAIKAFGDQALCIGKNKDGSPKHFMYAKNNTSLIKW